MAAIATGADYMFIPERPPTAEDWQASMCSVLSRVSPFGASCSIAFLAETLSLVSSTVKRESERRSSSSPRELTTASSTLSRPTTSRKSSRTASVSTPVSRLSVTPNVEVTPLLTIAFSQLSREPKPSKPFSRRLPKLLPPSSVLPRTRSPVNPSWKLSQRYCSLASRASADYELTRCVLIDPRSREGHRGYGLQPSSQPP